MIEFIRGWRGRAVGTTNDTFGQGMMATLVANGYAKWLSNTNPPVITSEAAKTFAAVSKPQSAQPLNRSRSKT